MNSKIDKNALALKIKALKGLSADEKSALLGLLNTRKKYGLVWEEKEEAVEELLREKLPVLTEVKEKRIVAPALRVPQGPAGTSANGEAKSTVPEALEGTVTPDHILIEGDNLHALTALQYTHAGKVDVIYIDPPYNTGNKDFVYNDSYVDKEDSFRHSKWLSFMSKRLRIAKGLLRESGVIFISIDDNEQAQLKLLCDEVFGEENSITSLVWSGGRKNDSKLISVSHEYIVTYVKSSQFLKDNDITWKQRKKGIEEIKKYVTKLTKELGPDFKAISSGLKEWYKSLPVTSDSKKHQHYSCVDEKGIYFPSDISWPGGGGPKYSVLHPGTGRACKTPARGWKYPTLERMLECVALGLVHFGPDETSVPCGKTYLLENEQQPPFSVLYQDSRAAMKRLREIMQATVFENPKDEFIIGELVQFAAPTSALILDFFAGSGTTLHATMALNAEDGGTRRCILVTNNENNICEEVTYERNKRVIQGYTKQNGESVPGLTNNNLRYYKTDFIDREPSMKNRKALTRAAVDLLCIRENCYIPHKQYDTKEIRVFTGKECELIIIFDPSDIDTSIEIIEKLYPGKPHPSRASGSGSGKPRCKVYVFSPGHYAYDEEFELVIDKIELCALPEAIYRAYKAVLPKAKRKFLEELEDSQNKAVGGE